MFYSERWSRGRRCAPAKVPVYPLVRLLFCLLALALAGCSAFSRIPTPEPVTIAFSCAERDQEIYERHAFEFSDLHPHILCSFR